MNRLTLPAVSRALLLLALCGFFLPAVADDFYAASVAVEDRGPENFKKGLRQALVRVLSKVSGAPEDIVLSRPALVQSLGQGDDMASQFIYHVENVINAEGGKTGQLHIKAAFPEQTVMDLLQKGGLTFWSRERASVRFWPLFSAAGTTRWLQADHLYQQQLQQALENGVLHWGFPVDMAQPESLDLGRLWRRDTAYINRLLQRYEQPIVLAQFNHLDRDGVAGMISLYDGQQSRDQRFEAASLDVWLHQAMDWVMQTLAAEHAVQLLSSDSEIVLEVDGINDYEAYQGALDYLNALDIVKQVYLLGVQGEQMRLAVTLKTDLAQLQKELQEDARLVSSDPMLDSAYQLNLRWQP